MWLPWVNRAHLFKKGPQEELYIIYPYSFTLIALFPEKEDIGFMPKCHLKFFLIL